MNCLNFDENNHEYSTSINLITLNKIIKQKIDFNYCHTNNAIKFTYPSEKILKNNYGDDYIEALKVYLSNFSELRLELLYSDKCYCIDCIKKRKPLSFR